MGKKMKRKFLQNCIFYVLTLLIAFGLTLFAGLATGVITTSGLVDATIASFTAHADHRDSYDKILEQMLEGDGDGGMTIEVRVKDLLVNGGPPGGQ